MRDDTKNGYVGDYRIGGLHEYLLSIPQVITIGRSYVLGCSGGSYVLGCFHEHLGNGFFMFFSPADFAARFRGYNTQTWRQQHRWLARYSSANYDGFL